MSDILNDGEAKTLVPALHDTLVKMKTETIGDRQRKVETKALLDTLAYILA